MCLNKLRIFWNFIIFFVFEFCQYFFVTCYENIGIFLISFVLQQRPYSLDLSLRGRAHPGPMSPSNPWIELWDHFNRINVPAYAYFAFKFCFINNCSDGSNNLCFSTNYEPDLIYFTLCYLNCQFPLTLL